MSLESAIARIQSLQTMLEPAAAPVQSAAQTGAAFAQQLQSAMQQGMTGTDPAAAGMQLPMGLMQAGGNQSLSAAARMPAAINMFSQQGAQGAYGIPSYASPVSLSGRVTGDVQGLNPDLLQRLDALGQQLGRQVEVKSGHRSNEEQKELYQRYLNGTGNLAAVPGTSRHESGNAADVYIDGVALANDPRAREIAGQLGLTWPVPGEPWHIEITR